MSTYSPSETMCQASFTSNLASLLSSREVASSFLSPQGSTSGWWSALSLSLAPSLGWIMILFHFDMQICKSIKVWYDLSANLGVHWAKPNWTKLASLRFQLATRSSSDLRAMESSCGATRRECRECTINPSGEVRNGKSGWIYTSIDLHAFWML